MAALITAVGAGLVFLALLVWREREHRVERNHLLGIIERQTAFVAEIGAVRSGIATQAAVHTPTPDDAESRLRKEISQSTREATERAIENGKQRIIEAYKRQGIPITDTEAREQAEAMLSGRGIAKSLGSVV